MTVPPDKNRNIFKALYPVEIYRFGVSIAIIFCY